MIIPAMILASIVCLADLKSELIQWLKCNDAFCPSVENNASCNQSNLMAVLTQSIEGFS